MYSRNRNYRPVVYRRPAVRQRLQPRASRPTGRGRGLRFILALVMAGMALFSYLGSKQLNPVTGEEQYVTITKEQEIALGLQAAPEMAAGFGGLNPDAESQEIVNLVGEYLVANSLASESGYPFEFHLLNDDNTVNAFALPGGQIFITNALFYQLETEAQLAGVLGHEIGHVIARHGAERIAQQELTQGLSGAVVLATYDPDNPSSQRTAQVALLIGQLVNMKFGREDELDSDWLGVCILDQAGYDPNAMIEVMEILDRATSSTGRPPEVFSTHPNPDNWIAQIQYGIAHMDQCP